ncbi:MAG: hypothetical protein GY804_02850 [Alphaproteobacteria bacterium]|nr:hypothetical protein [Alphaproteobacteria bacterium]
MNKQKELKVYGFIFMIIVALCVYAWASSGTQETVYDQVNQLKPWQAQQAIDNMSPQKINELVQYYRANDNSGMLLYDAIDSSIGYAVTLPIDIKQSYKRLIEAVGDHPYNFKLNDEYIANLAASKKNYQILAKRAAGYKFVDGKPVIDKTVEPYHKTEFKNNIDENLSGVGV